LLKDTTDFVKQGAIIALSMILQQVNTETDKTASEFKKNLNDIYGKKRHEDILVKLGAIIGTGILEAGGRNVTTTLSSPQGVVSLTSCVGMLVFT